jgi:hypothetical protein
VRRMADAVDQGLRDAAEAAQKDYESTTKTWTHQPTFVIQKIAIGYKVATDNDIWQMLDVGTKPHDIVASKIALRFPGGFRAKTQPGVLGSTSGGASGGAVFRRKVHHPGTKARGWSKLIAKEWRGRVAGMVQKRISEALR